MGAINSKNMYIDGTHAIFPVARDIQVADFQPRDNKYTRCLHIPTCNQDQSVSIASGMLESFVIPSASKC